MDHKKLKPPLKAKAAMFSVKMTPLWDEYYVKSQNKKFKNKWEKIKKLTT